MYFVHSSDHPCLWCCAAQKEGGKGSCCRRPHYCDIALCKMFKAAAVTADCTDRGGGEAARERERASRAANGSPAALRGAPVYLLYVKFICDIYVPSARHNSVKSQTSQP